jgi:hypothetical protein
MSIEQGIAKLLRLLNLFDVSPAKQEQGGLWNALMKP